MSFSLKPRTAWAFAWIAFWCLTISTVEAQVRRLPPPGPPEPSETAESEGEEKPSPDGNNPKDDESEVAEPATTLFGDPSRFNRFSGWGGIGGAMGQWGMGRSMMIMMPAVQEELELTIEQKEQLRKWQEIMRDRGREMGEQMRDQGREALSREGFNLGSIMGMMNSMTMILKENERGMARILDADQRRRLDQITMQMEGVTALARPEVAKAVRLNLIQSEQIQQILAQAKVGQIMYWVGNAQRMMPNRDRDRDGQNQPGGPNRLNPTQRPAPAQTRTSRPEQPATAKDSTTSTDVARATTDTAKNAEPEREPERSDGDPSNAREAPANARRPDPAARQEAMRQFEDLRSGADRLQYETVQRVLKVLTRRQRERFDKLLGEPFDPTRTNDGLLPTNPNRQESPDVADEDR